VVTAYTIRVIYLLLSNVLLLLTQSKYTLPTYVHSNGHHHNYGPSCLANYTWLSFSTCSRREYFVTSGTSFIHRARCPSCHSINSVMLKRWMEQKPNCNISHPIDLLPVSQSCSKSMTWRTWCTDSDCMPRIICGQQNASKYKCRFLHMIHVLTIAACFITQADCILYTITHDHYIHRGDHVYGTLNGDSGCMGTIVQLTVKPCHGRHGLVWGRGASTSRILGSQSIFSQLSGISPSEISFNPHVRVYMTSHWVKTYMHARLDNMQSKSRFNVRTWKPRYWIAFSRIWEHNITDQK